MTNVDLKGIDTLNMWWCIQPAGDVPFIQIMGLRKHNMSLCRENTNTDAAFCPPVGHPHGEPDRLQAACHHERGLL